MLQHRRWEHGENIALSSAPFDLAAGAWIHVAGTFSRTAGMAVYVEGKLIGLNMDLTKASEMKAFWVGASGNGATTDPHDTFGGFPGALDEVRIYRRELTPAEIARLARRD